MTGMEIPGVGMAPGGKIVKPEDEVNKHLCNMLTVAEAMSASMHWNFLAKYSILKEMFADLRSIVTTWCKQPACGGGEQGCREGEEHEHSGGSANLLLEKGMEKK